MTFPLSLHISSALGKKYIEIKIMIEGHFGRSKNLFLPVQVFHKHDNLI